MGTPPRLEIVDYAPDLLPDFIAINEAWIREMFVVEQGDIDTLYHAEAKIIEPGGKIFFARDRERGIVGTCALVKRAQGTLELSKMGVRTEARGSGAGALLLRHALHLADALHTETLFLVTNGRCRPAIHLYRKHGFRDDEEIMSRYGSLYQRCDVAMRYDPSHR